MAKRKSAPKDILTRKVIDLSTLRLMVAELQKDGYTEINIHDLLIYIKPVTTDAKDETV